MADDKIPKITEDMKNDCDKKITDTELLSVLKKFKKNKSPGIDGLTAEFYLQFWNSLKVKLLEVYEESFDSGALPESMNLGVITLLEKKGKVEWILQTGAL